MMNSKLMIAVRIALGAAVLTAPTMLYAAGPAPGPAADALDEVVVTATRREERLQDVPLAVAAIGAEQLSEGGFKTLQDIQYQMAGVQFGTAPNDSGFRLRGVGSAGGFTSSSEQNVGTVVDGVVIPFGNPVAGLGDVERIEVLKGPQGTQFGKNASSGVVSIATRRPTTDGVSGDAYASFAELKDRDVHGSINLPLGQSLALGISAFDRKYDGFIRNVVRNEDWGGIHTYGGRAKLLWQASDAFSAYLTADWSSEKRTGPGQFWTIRKYPSFANPLMAARFGPLAALGITPGAENDKSAEEFPGFGSEKNYGASLELNWSLGEHTLTSVTAYRKLDQGQQVFAIDGINLPVFTAKQSGVDRDYVSEEIRLTSPSGQALEYVTGIYWARQKAGYGSTNCAQLRPGLPFAAVIVNISAGCSTTATQSKTLAAFGDGSLRMTDQLRLLGGLRITKDDVDALSFSVIDPAFPPGPSAVGFVAPYTARPLATGSNSKTDWSGRIGLEFKASDDVLVFGTIARGYLGPTVTFSGLTGQKVDVDPQTVNDVTIGVKSQWLDRRLTLNGNVFYDKYKNLQTSVFNGLEFLTENAGGFKAKGFELDTSWRLSAAFGLNASYTYSDTEFTDYVTACPNSINAQGAAAIAARCNAPGSTASTPLFQAKGFPLAGAPRHTGTFGVDFNQPIGALKLDAALNYYIRSSTQYDVANSLSVQGGYSTVGANVGIGAANGSWRVGAFVRNAFDKRFQAAVIGLPFADAGGVVNWNTREGRRVAGVSVEAKF